MPFLRLPEVKRLTGLSRSSIICASKPGTFLTLSALVDGLWVGSTKRCPAGRTKGL